MLLGGWIKNQNEMLYTHAVEEYDPVTNKWTRKANLPSPKGNFSTSVVDGKIYAIGGDDSPDWTSPLVEEYDPITDKWTRKADMPTARSYLSTCAVNDKIYAIGGYKRDHLNGDIVFFSTVEEYDPKTDTWTKKTDMPTKRALGPSSASLVDGQIYVIGGTIGDDNGFDDLSSVEQYDPIADKWTQKANMPTARGASTAVVNGRIYAIGGHEGKMDQALATVEEYDPITDSWTKKNDMPTARSNLSTCAVNGRIYAIGGNMGGFGVSQELIPTSIVEVYDPNSTGESITPKGKLPTTWGEVRTASSK
jgi:N-acetylneuraminic acid mutarotase